MKEQKRHLWADFYWRRLFLSLFVISLIAGNSRSAYAQMSMSQHLMQGASAAFNNLKERAKQLNQNLQNLLPQANRSQFDIKQKSRDAKAAQERTKKQIKDMQTRNNAVSVQDTLKNQNTHVQVMNQNVVAQQNKHLSQQQTHVVHGKSEVSQQQMRNIQDTAKRQQEELKRQKQLADEAQRRAKTIADQQKSFLKDQTRDYR